MESKIIFTCQDASEENCLNEIHASGLAAQFIKWLDHGVGILLYQGSFQDFSDLIRSRSTIFLRHIQPIDYEIEPSDITDVKWQEIVKHISTRLDSSLTYSVQIRAASKSIKPGEIKQKLQDELTAKGYHLSTEHPKQVISIFCTDESFYIGLSPAKENMSGWPGGMRVYAFRSDTISRAEFKLMEMIEYFNLQLPAEGTAIDLGAAPGGWSKVLADRGLHVIAVDPAELSPLLKNNPRITHYKGPAQKFAPDFPQKADIIVNDMKMDPYDSIRIMNEISSCLKKDGLVIITLKLKKKNKMSSIKKSLELLKQKYNILHVKQLFHNRCEITIAATKKP